MSLDAGATLGPHSVILPGRDHRRAHARSARRPSSCAASGARGHAAGAATRSARGAEPRRYHARVAARCRRLRRPVPPRARQRRLPRRALRPGRWTTARDQPPRRPRACSPPWPTRRSPVHARPRRAPRATGARRRQRRRGSSQRARQAARHTGRGRSRPAGSPSRSRYGGNPAPAPARGATSAGTSSPTACSSRAALGAPSWFPCNDHPSDKATYRIAVTTESPLHGRSPPACSTARRRAAARATWVYEQAEPTATLPGQRPDRPLRRDRARRRPGATDRAAPGPAARARSRTTSAGTPR